MGFNLQLTLTLALLTLSDPLLQGHRVITATVEVFLLQAAVRPQPAFSDDACVAGGDILLPTPNLKVYSFADLKNTTRNFKSDMVLGVGVQGMGGREEPRTF